MKGQKMPKLRQKGLEINGKSMETLGSSVIFFDFGMKKR